MAGRIGLAALKSALAAWLLLTNLSLGLYHRHETAQDAHRAAPNGWHYHVLLLGVELDFLSCNTESSPFESPNPAEREAHLLLGNLVAPATDHEIATAGALLLALVPLLNVPSCDITDACALAHSPTSDDMSGLPPPASILGARSGVQQI
jgi:hypothetical protein